MVSEKQVKSHLNLRESDIGDVTPVGSVRGICTPDRGPFFLGMGKVLIESLQASRPIIRAPQTASLFAEIALSVSAKKKR